MEAESTNVTEDKSHIPAEIRAAPPYHDSGTNSPRNSIPNIAEQEKFAAVDREVPTTLPLSFIPSKNEPIMRALMPIMHSRQRPRVASDARGQTHAMPSFGRTLWLAQKECDCTAKTAGESEARASFPTKEAVAPRAPLRTARLLVDIKD